MSSCRAVRRRTYSMTLSRKLGGLVNTRDTDLVIVGQRQVVEASEPSRELEDVATGLARRKIDDLLEYRKHLCASLGIQS